MRQLFPPVTPDPTSYHPPPVPEPENEPVETKLTDAPNTHPPLAQENRVNNPHSSLYDALPLIAQPVKLKTMTATSATSINTQQAAVGAGTTSRKSEVGNATWPFTEPGEFLRGFSCNHLRPHCCC